MNMIQQDALTYVSEFQDALTYVSEFATYSHATIKILEFVQVRSFSLYI